VARAGRSGCRAAEVLGDRAHRHELAGRSGGHLWSVVTRRQEDGRQLVLGIERSGSGAGLVPAAFDQLQQPLGLERVHNSDLDLCARLLDADELADRPATGQRPPDRDQRARCRRWRSSRPHGASACQRWVLGNCSGPVRALELRAWED